MFCSQQEKKLLSGDCRAEFEMMLHGGPLDERFKGSKVQGLEVIIMKDGYYSGCGFRG